MSQSLTSCCDYTLTWIDQMLMERSHFNTTRAFKWSMLDCACEATCVVCAALWPLPFGVQTLQTIYFRTGRCNTASF